MAAYSFRKRFAEAIAGGHPATGMVKRRIIRAPRKRHARPGEPKQIYQGMRTKHRRLITNSRPLAHGSALLSKVIRTRNVVFAHRTGQDVLGGQAARCLEGNNLPLLIETGRASQNLLGFTTSLIREISDSELHEAIEAAPFVKVILALQCFGSAQCRQPECQRLFSRVQQLLLQVVDKRANCERLRVFGFGLTFRRGLFRLDQFPQLLDRRERHIQRAEAQLRGVESSFNCIGIKIHFVALRQSNEAYLIHFDRTVLARLVIGLPELLTCPAAACFARPAPAPLVELGA